MAATPCTAIRAKDSSKSKSLPVTGGIRPFGLGLKTAYLSMGSLLSIQFTKSDPSVGCTTTFGRPFSCEGSLATREFTNKAEQEASLLLVKKKGLLVLPTVSNAIPCFAYFSPNISSTSFACATYFLRATRLVSEATRSTAKQ